MVDLLLSGQLIAFNAVFADAAGTLLRGMEDTAKQQTMSSLVAMGRVTQGHVDRLAKRGNQPYLSVVAAQPTARPAVPPGPPPEARPEAANTAVEAPLAVMSGGPPPPAAAPPAVAPAAAAAPLPVRAPEPPSDCEPAPRHAPSTARTPPPDDAPPPEVSWLDEPYQEYVIETPGLLLAREQMAQTAAIFALAEAALRDTDATAPQPAALPDPKAS